jgi:arginine decarboxylase-like protein
VGEDEIEVNSKEALKKLFHKRKRRGHKRRKLVYPISVNTAKGVLEIADLEAMKAYKQSLEKGVRPEFVFPISVTVGEDEIEVNSKEALKKLFHKRKRRGRK